jgi:outer membrane protein
MPRRNALRTPRRTGCARGVRRSTAVLVLAPLLLNLSPTPAEAQGPRASGLTLAAAMEAALTGSPALQRAAQQVDGGRGELLMAGGAFDVRLTTSVKRERDSRFGSGPEGQGAPVPVVASGAEYRLGAASHLRAGVVLQPEIVLRRSGVDAAGTPANGASVILGVTAPLLRDRGGAALLANERAARALYDADSHHLRHTTAASVAEVAAAYWGYLAAQRRLQVHALAEERAQRFAEETRVMVEAGERPRSDLAQLLANVASKRMTRLSAEQAVVEERRRLGLAMGLASVAIATLGPPEDDFPAPSASPRQEDPPLTLVEGALARRADLATARDHKRSAAILLGAARSAERPRLDFSVAVGYTGSGTGGGLGSFVSPLYSQVPGVNASVQLQYQFAASNAEARGILVQRAALHEQQRIVEADAARRITTGVAVAWAGLRNAELVLEQARHAVDLYRATVENERTKNRLGVTTLFDVTLAEDGLTSALLSVVASEHAYAVAVVNLRYETATLTDLVDGVGVRIANLLTPP